MSKCPYTWVKSFLNPNSHLNEQASALRVQVVHGEETRVDITLPAKSARWLIDIIPADVVTRIRSEGIPLDAIQEDLSNQPHLRPQTLFTLMENHRSVKVWLE